jgi:Pentapeptide repeats (8 copies)
MTLCKPLSLPTCRAANLSSAVLEQATLVGCNLTFSNFAGANLNEADLRAAELREARNLTQAQIDQAYRASGGQDYIRNTQLPKPLQAPEAWNTLLSQQIAEREATSN